MSYARISITLPGTLLTAVDRRAKELDRPRSWVIAEAVRAWLDSPAAAARPTAVREPRPSYGARINDAPRGLGDQRLSQLRADLALTPEQRVIEAERTARAVPGRGARWSGVLSFERFEDFWSWKRREAAGQ